LSNKIDFKEIIDFIKDLIIIGLVVLIIRTFIAEPFQISGPSMYGSYYDKEFIIVDRFSYLDIP
jgi:signal peptidase I